MSKPAASSSRSLERFETAQQAWFWACAAMLARHSGSRSERSGPARACDPDDIMLCVERLLVSGRLDHLHARVLGLWGTRQMAPDPWTATAADNRLWSDAMAVIGAALVSKDLLRRTAKEEKYP
jgi:hypothetical protein